MKKVICFIMFIISILFVFAHNNIVFANVSDDDLRKEINVYIFKGEGCSFCSMALDFFRSIEGEYGDYFNLVEYEVWYNDNNYELYQKVANYFNETISGVPFIVIGKERFYGFDESNLDDIKKNIMIEYNKSDDMRFDIMNEFDKDLYEPEITYSRFAVINSSIKQLISTLSSILLKIKL